MDIADALRSPIYKLNSLVPELVMTVLLDQMGNKFLAYVKDKIWTIRGGRNELLPPDQIDIYTSGQFCFDIGFWNQYLMPRNAMAMTENPSQQIGVHHWDLAYIANAYTEQRTNQDIGVYETANITNMFRTIVKQG